MSCWSDAEIDMFISIGEMNTLSSLGEVGPWSWIWAIDMHLGGMRKMHSWLWFHMISWLEGRKRLKVRINGVTHLVVIPVFNIEHLICVFPKEQSWKSQIGNQYTHAQIQYDGMVAFTSHCTFNQSFQKKTTSGFAWCEDVNRMKPLRIS